MKSEQTPSLAADTIALHGRVRVLAGEGLQRASLVAECEAGSPSRYGVMRREPCDPRPVPAQSASAFIIAWVERCSTVAVG